MRIAVNTRFLIEGKLEGLGWHNYSLCKRLAEQHPEDEFIFLFDRPFSDTFIFGPNVKAVQVFPPARHPVLWYLWFEWALPGVLRHWQPDVFLSPDGYCSLRARVPTLLIVHDLAHIHYPKQIPSTARWYYQRYISRYISRAEQVVTVSSFVKQDIIQQYGIDPNKIDVAYNGLRGEFAPVSSIEKKATQFNYADGVPYFFYLGSIHPRKNIDRLIHAFDQFKQKTGAPLKLLIGGRFAWQTGSIKQAYSEAVFKKDIRFLGYLSESELPVLLGSALALVYPSLFEGFGLPILEAFHAEVPVITSDAASMPEVAGDAAILVNPASVEEIAGAMEVVWKEESTRSRLIQQGRIQRTLFSWDESTATIYRLLKRLSAR